MDTKKSLNRRAKLVGVIITLLFFLLLGRTFYIQAIEASMLREKALNIWNSSTTIEPKRGTIFDRNGERIAYNAPAYTVVAILSDKYTNHIENPELVAEKLAPLLGMEKGKIYSLLTKDAYQVELRPGGWKIDKSLASKIKELNISGIILKEETKRYYPNNNLASYVLGFLNYDNQAVMGVERQYDDILRGEPGKLKVMKDLKGYELPDSEEFFQPAKDGANLTLTIDKTIQQYVESALDKTEAMYHPKRMVAIVADPNTGEIFALANRPGFNPNKYWNITDYRNNSISYQFEPGSTFKVVTLAAAIEEGYFDPEKKFKSGTININGSVIHDHNNGKGWGEITFLEGVQRSSNVAFVKLGYEMLGKEKLYSYINNFGFGKKTGIDLPNEETGFIRKEADAYPFDVATMAFGQGISITPIQQLMAASAVANGGHLVYPYLVKEVRNSKTDEILIETRPTEKRRVISEETAKKTREVLEKVVEFDKQRMGYIKGYHVAGKTGTAQKIGEDGKYLKGKYIASFVGFAPANNPKLIVYVVVDEPDLNIPYFGSTIAVPIFKEIMQNSLRYLQIPVDNIAEEKEGLKQITLDDYTVKQTNNAVTVLNNLGLKPIVVGDGDVVMEQYPNEGQTVSKGADVYLITTSRDQIKVPNFIGMSLRQVLEYSYVLDLEVNTIGTGIVAKQNIKAGTLYKGQNIEVFLEDPTLID